VTTTEDNEAREVTALQIIAGVLDAWPTDSTALRILDALAVEHQEGERP
jgi:hypothetical protein